MWSRDIKSGLCKPCRDAEARDAKQEADRLLEERELSEIVVLGKTIECPICGGTRFKKQETLMNTRGATFMNLDWLNAGALTCICIKCGYVLWFRKE